MGRSYFDEQEAKESQLPESNFQAVSSVELEREAKKQMNAFSDLLNSLDKSLDKKKQLWKQIYENAVTDRKNAYLVFADLYINVHTKPAEHAIHGPVLSKYMERMSKATDQLIKLAELVAAAESKTVDEIEERVSDEDIYGSIQAKKQH